MPGSVMFASGSVPARLARGSSPGRRPRRFPAAAVLSQASCLARCASRRAWSSAASRPGPGQPLPPLGPAGQQPQHLAEQPAQRLLVPGPGTGRWWRDRDAARRRSPGRPHRAGSAARSPGWTARPGSRRTAAAPPSSPGRTPPARARQPGTGTGTRPDPGWPPRPAPRTPDHPRAATRACPPAAATADHAADKGSSAA
jgi:hypothetical protein